jgi:ubiquinone/menaquinone biosynthesis C-methylase UbiE
MPSQEDIDKLTWYHRIVLSNGLVTPGKVDQSGVKRRYLFPDVNGKEVADIGTMDGYWAIESKAKGASYVEAFDIIERPSAKMALGDFCIKYTTGRDMNTPQVWQKQFDVVLFYGVLYHLYNPTQGLRNAYDLVKTGGTLVVESAVNQGDAGKIPLDVAGVWIIPGIWADDPTNYTMPNIAGLRQMCRLLPSAEIVEETEIRENETRHAIKIIKRHHEHASETAIHRVDVEKYCHGNVLDIGSGGDPVVPWAIQVEPIEGKFVQYGRGFPLKVPIQLRIEDVALPFKDNSIDTVYSSHLLEDFEDWTPVITEWVRVTKPGGLLVLLLPCKKRYNEAIANGGGGNPHHKHEATIGELSSLASQYGLETIEDRYTDQYPGDYNILYVGRKINPRP